MKPDLNYPHPADSPWWYRLILSIWVMSVTIAALFAIVLTLWFLNEHGSYTTKEAETVSFAFTILSYGVVLGLALVTTQILGPHWIQDAIRRIRTYVVRYVRGVRS